MANGHNSRRDPIKQRFWKAHVAEWRRSGLSVREFCRREALSEPLFYSWRRQLARREVSDSSDVQAPGPVGRRASKAAGFVPVEIVAPRRVGQRIALEIILSCDRRIRVRPGFDPDTLEAVLEILERRTC